MLAYTFTVCQYAFAVFRTKKSFLVGIHNQNMLFDDCEMFRFSRNKLFVFVAHRLLLPVPVVSDGMNQLHLLFHPFLILQK